MNNFALQRAYQTIRKHFEGRFYDMGSEIFIQIEIKTRTGDSTYSLKPEEYFDISILSKGEDLQIDSVPQFFFTREYLKKYCVNIFDESTIESTKIILKYGNKTKIISEKYWNDGPSLSDCRTVKSQQPWDSLLKQCYFEVCFFGGI